MKIIYLTLLVAVGINVSQARNCAMSTATVDNISSQILKEQGNIFIHVPESSRQQPGKRYPVIYLLDGDWNFNSVVGMLDQRVVIVDKRLEGNKRKVTKAQSQVTPFRLSGFSIKFS